MPSCPRICKTDGLGMGPEAVRRPRIPFSDPPEYVRRVFVVCVVSHFCIRRFESEKQTIFEGK